MADIIIPPEILKCWREYALDGGFDGKVVAARSHNDLYAILLEYKGEFYAVQFNMLASGWEVTHDYVEFESLSDFHNAKFTQSFFF